MIDVPQSLPSWLPGLTNQVEDNLQRLNVGRHDQRPALVQELEQIKENVQGWSASLAKPTLAGAVREAIESQWASAVGRQQAIEAELAAMDREQASARQLVRPQDVLDRLGRLADILAANNATRGNLELSLHIDRIVCYPDRRVTLRMCKLGIVPDAMALFASSSQPRLDENVDNPDPSRARRRGKLRVTDEDGVVDLHAQADFIASPNRFVGLDDEWFWLDEFQIPKPVSWAEENAEAVYHRRQESRQSYAQLAKEFGVTSPTIGAAIRHYLKSHCDERDEVVLQRGGKRRPKFDLSPFAAEACRLWEEGRSKESLAKKFGCSAPTVVKAIAYAYRMDGLPVPTRQEMHRSKAAEARRLSDAGNSLDAVASAMNVSVPTARRYLRDSFAAEGTSMPDLRRRKPH